jgi:hypothetical protein
MTKTSKTPKKKTPKRIVCTARVRGTRASKAVDQSAQLSSSKARKKGGTT